LVTLEISSEAARPSIVRFLVGELIAHEGIPRVFNLQIVAAQIVLGNGKANFRSENLFVDLFQFMLR
jgi:hypothetical protein